MNNGQFKYVIPPIDRSLIERELTDKTFLKHTKKGGNELHILDYFNAPNTLKEIGRLREIAFGMSGGGTGKKMDLDHYDTNEDCYKQLIVYSREDKEIVGGYRFKDCSKIKSFEKNKLSTQDYFKFSKTFIKKYMPYSIELGRSWVNPIYQQRNNTKSIYALANLWDGLYAVSKKNKHIKYFFGKVTMYNHYKRPARNSLLSFLSHFFPDKEKLIVPKYPLNDFKEEFVNDEIKKLPFKQAFRKLRVYIKNYQERIPPLFGLYMQLSPSMKTFGTSRNKNFGNVQETGIMIKLDDIYEDKKRLG